MLMLRTLNNGGECLTWKVVEMWADNIELYNLCGRIETTFNYTVASDSLRTPAQSYRQILPGLSIDYSSA